LKNHEYDARIVLFLEEEHHNNVPIISLKNINSLFVLHLSKHGPMSLSLGTFIISKLSLFRDTEQVPRPFWV